MASVSVSSTGKLLHNDLNAAKLKDNSNLSSFNDKQRSGVINAVLAAIAALDVDGNKLHNNSLTIAVTLTTSAITIQIS